jgi:4'-phosphopantetheinyl transferase
VTALPAASSVPAGASLESGEVHVWTLDLDAVTAANEALALHLSRDELARAAGFVREVHRRRFLISHVFLRSVLGDYLGRQPAALEFGRTALGKPVLGGAAADRLHFSLSHSGSSAACAVAREPVGLDLEREQVIPEEAGVAERIFTPGRLARWRAEPAESRTRSLLMGWTRFEALAKAQGGGLVRPPGPIDLDGEPNAWQVIEDGSARWSVVALQPAGGIVLSVAVPRAPARLSVRQWHRKL